MDAKREFAVLCFVLIVFSGGMLACAGDEVTYKNVDELGALGVDPPMALHEALRAILAAHPDGATIGTVLRGLNEAEVDERELATYIVALGRTRDPKLVEPLIEIAEHPRSELIWAGCFQALTDIGTRRCGEFLLGSFEAEPDEGRRFDLLNALAQMQFEAALPYMDGVLKRDTQEYYWQPIFLFGKMGDKAVPSLLKKVEDDERNVRWHAIHVLGYWLMAPEAAQPLRDHYWKEKDPELRRMILSSLERITPDLDTVDAFSKQVAKREKDESLAQFAKETIANVEEMRKRVEAVQQKKSPAPEKFQAEYSRLFESAGLRGDYEILSAASTYKDEPELKRLRERILWRNSDESFYDYQKINEIIMFNRMTAVGK